jgi:hypothetical protein
MANLCVYAIEKWVVFIVVFSDVNGNSECKIVVDDCAICPVPLQYVHNFNDVSPIVSSAGEIRRGEVAGLSSAPCVWIN